MGVIADLIEKRSGVANPAQWLIDVFSGGESSSGISTTENGALSFPPIWAAVNIISGAVGTLPFMVYKRLERGKERDTGHFAYRLLHERPNPFMDALTFRETLQAHVLTWGNGYAEIERDGRGNAVNLWPIPPDRMAPKRTTSDTLYYEYTGPNGTKVPLADDIVLHIKGLGFDGFSGYSPIRQHMESIGLGRAAEKYGAKFFGQGSRPSGALEHPASLSDKAAKRLRDSFAEMHQGLDNSHRAMLLEEGMKWTQIGIPPEEAQFLETRKFQIADVARMYQVPLHMLAELDRATFSNIEHQGIEFVTHTLMRWLKRWEHECNYKLLGGNPKYFCEFVVDGMLRGDIKTRYEAYSTGRLAGWLSVNEIRALENLNPIDDGDQYIVPMNMTTPEKLEQDEPPVAPPDDDSNDNRGRVIESHRELLIELCTRLAHKEANALRKAMKHTDSLNDSIEQFYSGHTQHVHDVLSSATLAMIAALDDEGLRHKMDHGFLRQFSADYVSTRKLVMLESHNRSAEITKIDNAGGPELADQLIEELCNANTNPTN